MVYISNEENNIALRLNYLKLTKVTEMSILL